VSTATQDRGFVKWQSTEAAGVAELLGIHDLLQQAGEQDETGEAGIRASRTCAGRFARLTGRAAIVALVVHQTPPASHESRRHCCPVFPIPSVQEFVRLHATYTKSAGREMAQNVRGLCAPDRSCIRVVCNQKKTDNFWYERPLTGLLNALINEPIRPKGCNFEGGKGQAFGKGVRGRRREAGAYPYWHAFRNVVACSSSVDWMRRVVLAKFNTRTPKGARVKATYLKRLCVIARLRGAVPCPHRVRTTNLVEL